MSVTGKERRDGAAPEGQYLRPASRRKGPRVMPGWRDPDRAAQNWADCRRYLRVYGIVAALCLMVAAWHIGGLLGYWEGYADGQAAAVQRKESRP